MSRHEDHHDEERTNPDEHITDDDREPDAARNVDTDRDVDDEWNDDRAWELQEDEVARRVAADDDESVYADGRESDDDWLGDSLALLVIAAGVVLFVFPEPATSATGLLLIGVGVVIWAVTELL